MWPEQDDRRVRLRSAVSIARADPPHLVAGDLVTRSPTSSLPHPPMPRWVVFHSAVLNYVPPEVGSEFIELVDALDCRWVSKEGPSVVEFEPGSLPPSPHPT